MLTALIADDEPLVRIGIASSVPWEELGIVLVGEAGDGKEALRLYQHYHPDILIFDLNLSGISGLELLRQIRKTDSHCSVILVTNTETVEVLDEFRRLGVSAILQKSAISRDNLSQTVRTICQILGKTNDTEPVWQPNKNEWHTFLFDSNETSQPFPVQGITAIRLFPDEWLTPALKRSLFTLLIHRMGDADSCATVYSIDSLLFLWKKSIAPEVLPELARNIQDSFRISVGIVNLFDEKTPLQVRELVPQITSLLRDQRFFDEPLLTLDAAGHFYHEPLRYLQRELIQSIPLSSSSDRLRILKKYLDLYPGPLSLGFERIVEKATPLLEALHLSPEQHAFHKMIGQICAKAEELLREETPEIRPEIRQAMNYLSNHLAEDLSLEQISRMVNYESSYFSRLFSAETHCSYTNYLFRIRMLRAQELLRTTDLPIGEISTLCGFSDVSYFSMRFRLFSDMTPREWREKQA